MAVGRETTACVCGEHDEDAPCPHWCGQHGLRWCDEHEEASDA